MFRVDPILEMLVFLNPKRTDGNIVTNIFHVDVVFLSQAPMGLAG